MIDFLHQGGTVVWVIFAMGLIAIAIILERLHLYYNTAKYNSQDIIQHIDKVIDNASKKDLNTLKKGQDPLRQLVTSALTLHLKNKPVDYIEQILNQQSIQQIPRLQKRLNYLTLIANIATLTGLLGTILGLQTSFASLEISDATQKASLLAQGISQAMNTTAMGLIIAIPCLIAFTQLRNICEKKIEELDAIIAYLITRMEK